MVVDSSSSNNVIHAWVKYWDIFMSLILWCVLHVWSRYHYLTLNSISLAKIRIEATSQKWSITVFLHGMKATYVFLYSLNNNMYYVKQIAEHKENIGLLPRPMCWNNSMKMDGINWRLKITRTCIKDTGMLQPEYHKPLQVPSVPARLIG